MPNFFKNEHSQNIYFEKVGNSNKAIIFLHGITASRRFWDKAFHELSKEYSLYFVDLLGFGFSAKPKAKYNLETHLNALEKFIKENIKEKEIYLIGHSLGAIISLAYLNKHSDQIKKAYLLSLPYFHSRAEAERISRLYVKPSYFVKDTLLTELTCTLWCFLGGPITRKITPFIRRDLPKIVASDSLLHTYNSYISTLYNVVYNQNIPKLITNKVKDKIVLIHGEDDTRAPFKNVVELSEKFDLPLIIIPNSGHQLPITHSNETVNLLKEKL